MNYLPAYDYFLGLLNDPKYRKRQNSLIRSMFRLSSKDWYKICLSIIVDTVFFDSDARFSLYNSILPSFHGESSSSSKEDSILQLYVLALPKEPDPTTIILIDSIVQKFAGDEYTFSEERRSAIMRLESPAMKEQISRFDNRWQNAIHQRLTSVKDIPPTRIQSSPKFKRMVEVAEKELARGRKWDGGGFDKKKRSRCLCCP